MKVHTPRNHLLGQLDQLHISLLETIYNLNNTKTLLHLRQRWKNDQNRSVNTTKAANTVLVGQEAATLLCRESTLESPRLLTLLPK
jgi:hypothetical protein